MKRVWLWFAAPVGAIGVAGLVGAAAVACSTTANVALPYPDGAPDRYVAFDASPSGEGGEDAEEASTATDAGGDADAAPPPSRLLLTYNGTSSSEIAAFGLQSKAVDGRLTYPDYLAGTYAGTTAPWLLGEATDVVARLDAQKPWTIDAAWNVAMNDYEADAGYSENYSDPQAVIVGAGSKAYVLRYTRNLVAILDTAGGADSGAPAADAGTAGDSGVGLGTPVGSVDLSSELQAGGDGYVQPVAGVYVASQQRVYVLLGNINRNDVVDNGYYLECASTTPTIVAIDTATDTLVDLNGSAPGNGWPLVGYDPILGQGALVYDPSTGSSGRLLVVEAGCNEVAGDGGVGNLVKREIESVDLASGTATELLDLTAQQFPAGLAYISSTQAVVFFYQAANEWNPTTTTLGASIPNAPDVGVYGGNGNILGVSSQYASDGGFEGYSVVSVAIGDGGVTTLGTNPFTLTGGFLGGVTLWPAP